MARKSKVFICAVAAAAALTGLSIPIYAATSSTTSSSSQSSSTSESAPSRCHKEHHHHGFCEMELLSKISGKSVEEIESQYPQKTVWQIAKAMGKLDELKKSFLSEAREKIDKLVSEKKISSEDGEKIYADIEKRVSAIDGVNTVILGRPNFKPHIDD